MNTESFPGLQIQSPLTTTEAVNFKPATWPPSNDFPVVINASQNVVSRYGDIRWDLSPWAGHTLTIHFGDGPGQGKKLSPENAQILRQIMGWWLWGEGVVRSSRALVYRFETIKPLFVACTDSNIVVTELHKHPQVIESITRYYNKRAHRVIDCLHSLLVAKKRLGFLILDKDGIAQLSNLFTQAESTQTAYIPPRIWSYQVAQLRGCLEDFIKHKEKIEMLYDFCLSAYARNAGGDLSKAFGGLGIDGPFTRTRKPGKRQSGKIFYGSFHETAEEYGVSGLLDRWVLFNESTGVRALSSYLTLVSYVGMAYVMNFSLMRMQEGSKLRANCYEIERDQLGDDIHILKGVTTKTIDDSDARWIVSPTVEIAVKAMKSVAFLRLKAAKENPFVNQSQQEFENPLLQSLPHEPWSPHAPNSTKNKKYKKIRSYGDVIQNIWPKLFDPNALKITESDLEIANRLTFGLDPDKYAVGKVWPLAWHQLRRTGAVNMLASGLVTEASLQYQLKHASRAMSQYYGKNFYRLKEPLSEETRAFYLSEMYQSMVREFEQLQSGHYVSPHGEKRKQQILYEVSKKDHDRLLSAAKSGQISYRQTFLGGCANSGAPCPLGGVSNISSCMGFGDNTPCSSALLDKTKLPVIEKLKGVIKIQMSDAEPNSPFHKSLQAQLESAERAIHVIKTS